tara:strand:- start:263 stop:652 length:390 start_codon:yes stop_codon:yes gene_type:complete
MAHSYHTVNCQVDIQLCILCDVCLGEAQITGTDYDEKNNPHIRTTPCECVPSDKSEKEDYHKGMYIGKDALGRHPWSENTCMVDNLWESTIIDMIKEHTREEGFDFWEQLQEEMAALTEGVSNELEGLE